jgi:hypothetical protein
MKRMPSQGEPRETETSFAAQDGRANGKPVRSPGGIATACLPFEARLLPARDTS